MREIIEHYGMELLAAVEVMGVVSIVGDCMKNGGMIYQLVECFMQSICG